MTDSNNESQPTAGAANTGGSESNGPSATDPGRQAPGDEAAPGTPGTGEGLCRECGGSGSLDGSTCKACGGTGKVTVGIGGA